MKRSKTFLYRLLALAFWLGLWQLVSWSGKAGLFLASPFSTAARMAALLRTGAFWKALLFTTGRILGGFALAVAAGCLLAGIMYRWRAADILITPVMRLIRTVPVVSFIILALILLPSRYLTQLISFLMALPVIVTNVQSDLGRMDRELAEMARLFRVPFGRRLRYLILPQLAPGFRAASSLALSFAWKSGIAAEVIGIPVHSVGENLYRAKVYLDTPDLFAWTLAVVLLSAAAEKVWKILMKRLPGLTGAGLEKERDGR